MWYANLAIVMYAAHSTLFFRSMGDVDGAIVAKRVYEELFHGDGEFLGPDTIPYTLDEAMHDLRRRGLHVSRWAPYVHLCV